MLALTVHQPWAWLISVSEVPMLPGCDPLPPKRIENRTWRPWTPAGELLAIHAGKTIEESSIDHLVNLGVDVPGEWITGAVLAVCRLAGSSGKNPEPDSDQAVWHVGPFAWILQDVQRLPTPVFTQGKQGLWKLPSQAERTVRGLLADEARLPPVQVDGDGLRGTTPPREEMNGPP